MDNNKHFLTFFSVKGKIYTYSWTLNFGELEIINKMWFSESSYKGILKLISFLIE